MVLSILKSVQHQWKHQNKTLWKNLGKIESRNVEFQNHALKKNTIKEIWLVVYSFYRTSIRSLYFSVWVKILSSSLKYGVLFWIWHVFLESSIFFKNVSIAFALKNFQKYHQLWTFMWIWTINYGRGWVKKTFQFSRKIKCFHNLFIWEFKKSTGKKQHTNTKPYVLVNKNPFFRSIRLRITFKLNMESNKKQITNRELVLRVNKWKLEKWK